MVVRTLVVEPAYEPLAETFDLPWVRMRENDVDIVALGFASAVSTGTMIRFHGIL